MHKTIRLISYLSIIASARLFSFGAIATENLPRIPFAESAQLPEPNQFVVTPWYYYTVFRKLWIGDKKTSIEIEPQQDFELNDGMLRVDYGLNERLALDLNVGVTSAATRSWNPQGDAQTTLGLMDTQFGVRYRVLDEFECPDWYIPTLTLRAGGIIKGTYDANFRMAPGDGASGFEAAAMLLKTWKPWGIGVYGDFAYRLRDNHVPQTIAGAGGLSETIALGWLFKSLTINAGYRGLYDLNDRSLPGGALQRHRMTLSISATAGRRRKCIKWESLAWV